MLPRLEDFDDPTFDPFMADDAVFGDIVDPYTPIDEIRRRTPVVESSYSAAAGLSEFGTMADPGQREFLVLGHEEVTAVATDPETYPNGPAFEHNLKLTFGNTLSCMDPPEHGRYRKLFQKAFMPHVIQHWGETIVEPVVSRLIDGFADRGRAELIDAFVRPYPFQIIFGQLALPDEDRDVFHRLAVTQTLIATPHCRAQAQEASAKLGRFLQALVDLRRAKPGDDLVSMLSVAEAGGERLPDDVIVSFLRQLLNAGGDTTFRCTGSMLFGLLTNPDQLDAVRADRNLVANAVEEALRWETPSGVIPRYVAKDVRLGGVDIPKGSRIELFFSASNRNEDIHPDPQHFDVHRGKTRHYGFGTGPHICIGQHLARLEMGRALNALLDRLSGLRLDPDQPPPAIRGLRLRYPRALHVRFDQ